MFIEECWTIQRSINECSCCFDLACLCLYRMSVYIFQQYLSPIRILYIIGKLEILKLNLVDRRRLHISRLDKHQFFIIASWFRFIIQYLFLNVGISRRLTWVIFYQKSACTQHLDYYPSQSYNKIPLWVCNQCQHRDPKHWSMLNWPMVISTKFFVLFWVV
jgi:hypothetical protein